MRSAEIRELCTGLLLAGGAGTRVGRRDKGLLEYGGQALAARIAAVLQPQVSSLIISCNRNIGKYSQICARTLSDTRPGFQGPLAGIEAAIPLLRTRFLVVAPCDVPLLPGDIVERLVGPLLARDTAAIGFANDGVRDHYLCAAIDHRCLSDLPAFLDAGGRAVRLWYGQHRCIAVDFSDCPGAFRNLNEPD